MTADATMPVGVVIERRAIANAWQSHRWHVVGVLPHAEPGIRWRRLGGGEGWDQFQAATLPLELFRGETEGYLANLSQEPPRVFVVLRPGEEADDRDIEPFHVTACPHEAMSYADSGEDIVEAVPMPPEVVVWVGAFVERHHIEVPFRKRRNKRHRDHDGGTRPRGRFGPGARP